MSKILARIYRISKAGDYNVLDIGARAEKHYGFGFDLVFSLGLKKRVAQASAGESWPESVIRVDIEEVTVEFEKQTVPDGYYLVKHIGDSHVFNPIETFICDSSIFKRFGFDRPE